MPPIALDELRAAETARATRVREAQEALAAGVQARIEAQAAGDDAAARRRVARAVATEERLSHELREAMDDLGHLPELVAVLTPDEVLASLEPNIPLTLLPVRLETRYRTVAGASQLHVRVYPEPIHADAHEPELTAEELAAGQEFWAAAAGGDDAAREAWATLARAGGEQRAAWIRLATAPGAAAATLKRAPWSRAARAAALPDYFVFLALRGGKRIATAVGNPIKRPLLIGPDPAVKQGTGPASLDEGTRWMVEFDEAERVGMAARLSIPGADQRVDRLLAVGIAASLTPLQAAAELDRLLGVHRFTDGLGLVAAGTATNVSSVASAPTVDDVYARESGAPPSAVRVGATVEEAARAAATDAARLASALGAGADPLGRSEGAGGSSEPDARSMLAVLWPGTLGYYLSEMLSGSVTDGEAEQLRAHAVAWVRPRGPLATLRIGSQPYGVLPVTSLARYAPAADAPSSAARFVDLLRRLDGIWATAARTIPRAAVGADPEAAMAEILGQAPLAVDYEIRKIHYQGTILELAELAGLSNDERAGLATLHEGLTTAGARVAGRLSEADGLRFTVASDGKRRLVLPRVQSAPLSDVAPLADNYLTFLRTASVADVVAGERLYGSPLLYLLARIGVLYQYVRAVQPSPGLPTTREEWLDRHVIVDGLAGVPPRKGPLDLLTSVREGGPTGPPLVDVIRTGAIDVVTKGSPIFTGSGFGLPVDGIDGVMQPPGAGVAHPPEGAVIVQPPGGVVMVQPRGAEMTAEGPPGAVFGRAPSGFATGPVRPLAGGAPERTSSSAPAVGSASFAATAAGGGVTFAATAAGGAAMITTTTSTTRAADAVAEVLAGLGHLESRPTSVLDRLLRETLDLAGHRLDAWVTSLATERLNGLRATGTPGVHLGAFGWIEDLRPGAPLAAVPATQHPKIARPLVRRADSAGFVHAPSLPHAATAGVLRSAHLAHGGGPELAIDLSSRRVRTAMWLLEGVRAGQPLGALLGYRIERALHERGLDRLIAGLRDAAPLTRTRLAGDAEPSEAVAAHDVVDGLRLLELLEAGDLIAADLAPSADRAALSQELAALADAADAVADLLLAESVHHVVGGNPARASAATGAASGGHVPRDIEVVRTPRTGTAVVHRVALVHGGAASKAWPAGAGQVRAVLDPVVEDFAARWLGPPSRVRVGIRWRSPASGDVLAPNPEQPSAFTTVTLDALGLSALDVVMTAAAVLPDTRGEVERRLADLALRAAPDGLRPTGVGPDAVVELVVGIPQVAGGLNLPTLLEVATSLRRALGRSRSLEPADLAQAGAGDAPAVVIAGLDARVATALGVARAARDALTEALDGDDAELDLDAVRDALRAVASIGLPGTWPLSAAGDDDDVRSQLLAQARSVAAELEARLTRAGDAVTGLPSQAGTFGTAADAQARRTAVRDLFGEELPLLASVGGDACVAALKVMANPPDLGAAGASRAGRATLVRSYVAAAATVRRDLAALDEALGLSTAVDAPEPAAFVAQLGRAPAPTGERWVGLAEKPGPPVGGRTSLVALAPAGDPAGAKEISGLLVDEWVEVVPRATEVTALAVHANRPNAEAPQAVLLAVPPDPAKAWDLDTLSAVLEETMDRATRRMVDLPALSALGQHLPALYINSTDILGMIGVPFDRFVVPPVRR